MELPKANMTVIITYNHLPSNISDTGGYENIPAEVLIKALTLIHEYEVINVDK